MTAEEFLHDFNEKNNTQYSVYDTNFELIIEFAKHHVEKALKSASEQATASNKAKFEGDINPQVDTDSILEAYPLENIKQYDRRNLERYKRV